MKILQVTSMGHIAGGAEVIVRFIRDELTKRGHDVKVLSSDVKGPEMLSDYTFRAIPSNSLLKAIHHLFYFRSYFAMRSVINSFKPDIIHFHTTTLCSPSVFFAIKNIPAVMTIHGPEEFTLKLMPWLLLPSDYKKIPFDLNLRNLTISGKLRYIYHRFIQRPIYKIALRHVDVFITPSKYFAELIRVDVPLKKIRQIYNGINLPTAKALLDNNRVLYVGRLEKLKGVDYLIRAFADVVSKIPEAELHIIGDGNCREELETLVFELNIKRNVIFHGWIKAGELLLAEYEKAQMLVIPSIWPENLPTVCIEAFAVGRPVIGSRTGGIPELIQSGQTGYVVPIKDSGALKDAMINLLEDKASISSMGVAASISAKKFSISNFIDKIESLYQATAQ